ncbi:BCL2 modifying factor 2 [Syngnathoides biaculeatus]|uniref:BCL2 modifying factor 2 n=1 Tax=Syngnathoides biaculeatus TaxID=300417 RepID=UPI002ADDF43D|nr:BCL2 modifying factor 2 [Syngnathoides biaculeatus]
MDDEEEDTSRLRPAAFGGFKCEERPRRLDSRPDRDGVGVGVPALASRLQHRLPFHGNAALRSHFPAQFQPLEDRGARLAPREDGQEEEDGGPAEGPGRGRAGLSPEAQIGQKLREIGDKFQRDHVDLLLGQNLPTWMRLTMAALGFLFPRPRPVPRHR